MANRNQILSFHEDAPPPGMSPWVVQPAPSLIEVVEYNPEWPVTAERVVDDLRAVLRQRAIRVDHVGSTSVPGLAAKPVIDLDLTVADPNDEQGWLPQLQEIGFVLTVREPWWHGHRLLQAGPRGSRAVPSPTVNLHVFGPDSPELVKHIVFRDWLRADPTDRELYAAAKRSAAAGPDQRVMDYNTRKWDVILDIYQRAFRAAGFLS